MLVTMARSSTPRLKVRFEKNFFGRSHGSITRNSDIALTELVANAWDAGAFTVKITIPSQAGDDLVVEDDGCGLTPAEFSSRWMTLAYSRTAHQGTEVEFPPGRTSHRHAFGRNGVGRHGLFCFGNAYDVLTCKAGVRFAVAIEDASDVGDHDPVKVRSSTISKAPGALPGTRLSVRVQRQLPDPEQIRELLACRFVADPEFRILVNDVVVVPHETDKLVHQEVVTVGTVKVHLKTYDSGTTGRTARQSGVAFWVGKRLVGKPSWTVGEETVLDGRIKHAKRLIIVAETNDLFDAVRDDWSGFHDSDTVQAVYAAVVAYAERIIRQHLAERVEETTGDAIRRNAERLRALDPEQRSEVSDLLTQMTTISPAISQEQLEVVIAAASNVLESKRGHALLSKLSTLSAADIDTLDEVLSQWSVQDCQTVLGELHRRMSQIEAIEKLMGTKGVDELRVLHPLVTGARWLFGPEYDSSEFTSNITIKNAMTQIFKTRFTDKDFINPRKRPDLIIIPDHGTLAATATEVFESGESLSKMHQILLIELKCGGFPITREEVSQAAGYVQDLHGSGKLFGAPTVTAYVVGFEIAPRVAASQDLKDDQERRIGTVIATTYGRLVATANRRLYKLRERIDERYKDISQQSLIDRILNENGVQHDFLRDPAGAPIVPLSETAVQEVAAKPAADTATASPLSERAQNGAIAVEIPAAPASPPLPTVGT